jgi:3-hydroxybutyrate dehydrogenase
MSRFKGRVAIITGAASGIGKEIAIRLAAEGGSPVVADLNLDAARKTAEEIKAKHGDAFAELSRLSRRRFRLSQAASLAGSSKAA